MKNNNDIELLDNYIRNSLSDEEKVMLEKRLLVENDLRDQLTFLKTLPGAIRYQQELEIREFLTKNTSQDGEVKVKNAKIISINRYIRVASMAAILIITFIVWQPNNSSDEKLFQQYFSDQSINVPLERSALELVPTDERSRTYKLKGYSIEESQTTIDAISLFNENKFEEAEPPLQRVYENNRRLDEVAFYYAVCQLKTGKNSNSIKLLENLQKNAPNIYPADCAYYLGLAYLEIGERSKAKVLLKEVVKSNSKLSKNAQLILDDLRWF